MIDLAEIEHKVKAVEGDVVSALERDAHTKVGEILIDTAKQLLPFVPDGAIAEKIINTLVSVAEQAHTAIHAAAGASDPLAVATDVAAGVQAVEAGVTEVKTEA